MGSQDHYVSTIWNKHPLCDDIHSGSCPNLLLLYSLLLLFLLFRACIHLTSYELYPLFFFNGFNGRLAFYIIRCLFTHPICVHSMLYTCFQANELCFLVSFVWLMAAEKMACCITLAALSATVLEFLVGHRSGLLV